jgi:hypothetical protein
MGGADVGLESNKIATPKIGCEQCSPPRMREGYFGHFRGREKIYGGARIVNLLSFYPLILYFHREMIFL